MKRVLILLAVATITAESVGCCCLGTGRGCNCCPVRRWFYQGDYCGTPCCPAPVAAAPCCPAPVAAAPAPCCPAPVAAQAPCCPAPQYQYAAPQPAPMMACPTCNQAPNYAMTNAMEPNCAYPKLVYDSGWMMDETGCSYSGMGGEDGMILQSPGDAVYPGPAE
jgi:hypothetical protein